MPAGAAGQGPVVFTIAARNYLAHARVLMAAVRRHHPRSRRFVFLCDAPGPDAPGPDTALGGLATLVPARDLAIPDFPGMAFAYSLVELATAIKPSCFLHLAAAMPGAALIYLDPDMLLTGPLDRVLQVLQQGASLVLTPHISAPLQDGHHPDDIAIMKSGVFNLGFAALRPTAESVRLLHWWRDRCRRDAVIDIEEHKFTDQRWMDLAPAFVRDLHILHEHAYHLAFWNLANCRVSRSGGRLLVDGEKLRCVHFSGLDPANPAQFSKYQDRFRVADLGALQPLFRRYIDLLHRAGWEQARAAPYAYAHFASGRPIPRAMRLAFRRHEADFAPDPFAGDGSRFDTAAPELDGLGPPAVTRPMYELWAGRPDLAAWLDLRQPAARETLRRWFGEGGAAEAGLDAASIAAAEHCRVPPAIQRATPPPPWPAQSGEIFPGPVSAIAAWLAEPVADTDPPLPRQFALAWEGSAAIAEAFGDRVPAFLAWCLTEGAATQQVDAALLPPALVAWLDETERPAEGEAPPATRLMRLLAPRYDGPHRAAAARFPDGSAARQAVALWLLASAPRLGWPPGCVASLDAWGRRRAAAFAESGPPIPRLLDALWQLDPAARASGARETLDGQMHFLVWLIAGGMRAAGLNLACLSAELCDFLAAPLGAGTGLLRLHHLCWLGDPALRAGADPDSAPGRRRLLERIDAATGDAWSPRAWADLVRRRPNAPAALPAAAPLLLVGMPDAPTGRGEDLRMLAAALRAAGLPHEVLDRAADRPPDAPRLRPRAAIICCNADTALLDHVFLRRAGLAPELTIGQWAWELPELPARWRGALSFCDEIWASSRFSAEAFRRAGARHVEVMPPAVAPPAPLPGLTRADFGIPEGCFVFCFAFDVRSFSARKNPAGAIAAFRTAFPTGREPAALVLKSSGGASHAAELRALQALAGGDPRIVFRDYEYTAREMATLLSLCDAFVSLHRAEGFGRLLAEAMLLDKPVIATGWSGNLDFMDDGCALLVRHRLVPVSAGEYPGGEAQCWAEPDLEHAAEAMRWMMQNPHLAERLGRSGRTQVARLHGLAAVGAALARRLEMRGASVRRKEGLLF